MKKLMRLLTVAFILVGLIATLGMTAYASLTDFTVKDGVLTKYTGTDTSVVIPDNLGITKIGDYAFAWNGYGDGKNEKITSITLPETVTSIGDGAFRGCFSLSSINITSRITSVGSTAFLGTVIPRDIIINNGTTLCYVPASYKTYSMPDSVTTINVGALWSCDNLETLTVSKNVTSLGTPAPADDPYFEGNGLFGMCEVGEGYGSYGCYKLTSLIIPNNSTNIIGDGYPLNQLCVDLTIYGNEGSNAQQFAKKYNIPFVLYTITANTVSATPTSSSVLINSSAVGFQAYNIGGSNYFKLRDLAMALNGSVKQFSVSYDPATAAITLSNGQGYTPIGGELAKSGGTAAVKALSSQSTIYLNGQKVDLVAYNIGGSNYFKLRDIGKAMNFGVTWDGPTNTIKVDTSTGYTD